MIILTYHQHIFYSDQKLEVPVTIELKARDIPMTLNIEQFHYGTDNFAYLIYGIKEAIAVDGGAWQEILSFLKQRNLTLKVVTNTHSHYDHTPGNDFLLRETSAKFIHPADFQENQQIIIDGEAIRVYLTPGHTGDSVCFHAGKFLVTGDTLFNGTIGNCFSGSMNNFFLSIKKMMALPDETVIYAGHDYVLNSLTFAQHLEPDNPQIDIFRKFYNAQNTVFSTLAQERRINPYLRFNEEALMNILRKNDLPRTSEWERWNSLMSIE